LFIQLDQPVPEQPSAKQLIRVQFKVVHKLEAN
jgi:hypothetical protein